MENHSPVSVSYYQAGFINEMSGIVTKLETLTRQITLMDYENDEYKLSFDNVVSVDVH